MPYVLLPRLNDSSWTLGQEPVAFPARLVSSRGRCCDSTVPSRVLQLWCWQNFTVTVTAKVHLDTVNDLGKPIPSQRMHGFRRCIFRSKSCLGSGEWYAIRLDIWY